jgi:NAD-dependent protein deacetylase/lipoamidase
MPAPIDRLDLALYKRIVVLTGAGVSVASGLRPYRGPGGLWEEDPDAPTTASAETMARDPGAVWRLFGPLRAAVHAARPNPAHLALAAAQAALRPDASFTLLTQNVDGLHQAAGSQGVIELHGSLSRTRCSACDLPPFPDREPHADGAPLCPRCAAPLRPDLTLFGEGLPVDAEHAARRALRDCDLFLAVGTSGSVAPASSYARSADYVGARTVLVNLEPADPPNPYLHEQILGPAEEILPALLGVV